MSKKIKETVNQDAILSISDLHKKYNEGKQNEVHALRGVDLEVKKGDMMAIMGASGCGKTTLLNMIGHLDKRSSGSIIIDGIATYSLSDSQMTAFRRDNIGFIFQLFNLFPFLTAVENVETPLLLKGIRSGLAREQAKMLLRELGMGDRLYHLPTELSGGQQQRVAVARALINQPAIILGDEPTGDLDSETGKQVMELIKKFHEETNTTVIIITHEADIAAYAQRQIKIEDGVIVN